MSRTIKYLALLATAAAGISASTALATDYHPPRHPTDEHPPGTTTVPPVHPPVTVTVTTPTPPVTVTVDRPAPPAATGTTPGQTVTVVTPPARIIITKTKVKWRTKTVVKWRTKVVTRVVCPDPPPQPKIRGCEGDCKKVFEGANG